MEGENLPRVVCTCGADILPEDIEMTLRDNEEGEELGVVSAVCGNCKSEWETFQWGWFDDNFEACQYLSDYLNNLHE